MQNNQIIINERDTGKTTYLLSEIGRLHQEGVNVVVMDSATEHEEKSLLRKTCRNFKDTTVIDMRKQKQPDPRASRLYAQRRSRFKTHAGQSG